MTNQFTMFETIRSWFQPAQEPVFENKWDANTVTMQQPNSPAGPAMNQAVSEQPESPESMAVVHMRGGGGGDICCGICAGFCCGDCCGPDGPHMSGPPGPP